MVDTILRSPDGVEFYVSRPFLPSAFDELFSNANGESKDGLTVIRVTDDNEALHHFLCALRQPMNKPLVCIKGSLTHLHLHHDPGSIDV